MSKRSWQAIKRCPESEYTITRHHSIVHYSHRRTPIVPQGVCLQFGIIFLLSFVSDFEFRYSNFLMNLERYESLQIETEHLRAHTFASLCLAGDDGKKGELFGQ
jgi:hypothetical protein